MGDDAGFADFGYPGGVADTPVLDKLAAGGMRFTRAYSNVRCMPTRSSLMTGLNPQLGEDSPISGKAVTIPAELHQQESANLSRRLGHLR